MSVSAWCSIITKYCRLLPALSASLCCDGNWVTEVMYGGCNGGLSSLGKSQMISEILRMTDFPWQPGCLVTTARVRASCLWSNSNKTFHFWLICLCWEEGMGCSAESSCVRLIEQMRHFEFCAFQIKSLVSVWWFTVYIYYRSSWNRTFSVLKRIKWGMKR